MKLDTTTRPIRGDFGQVWISESIAESKPDGVRGVTRLFERQSRQKRRANAYRAMASMMAKRRWA